MFNMDSRETLKIGMLGFGTVGQGVYKHLQHNRDLLQRRIGVRLEVARIGVRDLNKPRAVKVPPAKLTTDMESIVNDPDIDIVCELMGGIDRARDLTLRALRNGKCVVTGNKALVSEFGDELFASANAHNAHYFFEASVAGGIPIIKVVREGLIANRFSLIYGILNGTCNYILTRMEREGASFETILADAQRLGYAEAEASLDVDGWDSAHKAIILGYLAHGRWMPLKRMLVQGIRDVTVQDITYARDLGYRIKLLALITRDAKTRRFFVRVHPTLLPLKNTMAAVDDVFNAVSVTGDVSGTTLHIGRGAGQDATASAVISDLADAALTILGAPEPIICEEKPHLYKQVASDLEIASLEEISGRYYLRLNVKDAPGVLEQVAHELAKNGVSVASMIQRDDGTGKTANLIFTTHLSNEKSIGQAVKDLKNLPTIKKSRFCCVFSTRNRCRKTLAANFKPQ